MALTAAQVKGKIKSLASQSGADPRVLIRIYMMEQFLKRVAVSRFADNFIIKGGILVTSMVGIAMRSTMDIDTSLRNLNLSGEDARSIVAEIAGIDLGDSIQFQIKDVARIMDELEYPGIRIVLDAVMGKMVTPIKIDISTGDVITPRAITYSYKLMLEEQSINLWAYNLETVLAEKLQTVLVRGVLNTRMRDYYDIHTLLEIYSGQINRVVLTQAFHATCAKRDSLLLEQTGTSIIREIEKDMTLNALWSSYQKKYSYAAGITFADAAGSVAELYEMLVHSV